jgi:drug/metabolite transporter (DMT)-like permease
MPPPTDTANPSIAPGTPLPPAEDPAVIRGRLMAMGLMIVSSVMISFGALLSRFIEDAGAWQINIHRPWTLGAVVLGFVVFRYRGDTVDRFRKIGRWGLIGGASLAVAGVAFVQSITTTTVANCLFTLSAIPFITAAFARLFLGERLKRLTLITMIVAGCGVGIMVADGIGGGSLYGNLMALVTAVGFSGYAVIVRHNRHIDMLPTLVVSSVFLVGIALVGSGGDWAVSWHDFVLCFLWGGVLSGIGNIMFVYASRHLMAAELTLFMLLEFALGPVWVWWIVNEVPSAYTLVGGSVIMSAVLVRTVGQFSDQRRVKRGRLAGPT